MLWLSGFELYSRWVPLHCTRNRNLIRIILPGSTCSMCTVFCQSLNSHCCCIITFFHRGSFDDLPNQVNGEKTFILHPEKTAGILRRHHWVPCEMNERRNSTLMTSYYVDLKCFWLVVPQGKFASTNQKYHLDLGSDTSFAWYSESSI